ncbi:MAG: cytochrome c biogenesis protein CcsA, partial [Alphaproteobacteria bacterium]|nr:cytochrome c biogenesis protein CcsA [Alphaproteobacteria bacterium]
MKTHTFLQFGLLTIALLKLINLHINTDYRFLNVVENSHEFIPLLYKITGVWANHEGSMLLLVWAFSFISFIFSTKTNFNKHITNTALCIQSFVVLSLIAIILITSNPFILSKALLPDGNGFNPLLQDIGLTIHPPILYLGYAGLSVPAALSISVLLHKKTIINTDLIQKFHPWIIAPWALLTVGISLGSWWAYRELGWGGFWFWDPVENVSLIVWIASTISLHMLKLVKSSGISCRHFFISNVSTFILSFFGMVLVRSGVLVSVHSFAFSPEKGLIMLIVLLIFTILSIYIFYKTRHLLNNKLAILNDKTTLSLTSNIALLFCACIVIILGITYPIIADFLYGQTVSIDEGFYTKTLSIFFLPIIYIAGIYSANTKRNVCILLLLSAVILALINYTSEISGYLNLSYIHASIFLILSLLKSYRNISKLSMKLGHLGFAIL